MFSRFNIVRIPIKKCKCVLYAAPGCMEVYLERNVEEERDRLTGIAVQERVDEKFREGWF